MIHYHGTPIGGSRQDVARFLVGRHALVPYPRQDDMGAVAEFCQSFCLDNGAFSVWRQGGELDVPGYLAWCLEWHRHPGFDFAIIPDVIEGSEAENDELIRRWPKGIEGAPVWHMHETPLRLAALCREWRTVCIGSSGEFASPGTARWWRRMNDAMRFACDERGRPLARLHGLRMLDPAIFTKLPLASADSTNAAVNSGSLDRFGMYLPPTAAQRAAVIAERIEQHSAAPHWEPAPVQADIFTEAA